ncbi:hypothetical protein PRNP1_012846 [Phytophthora ramorum]
MGSFLPLDELEPTLSDVLAFIDTFDSDTTTSTSSSSDDGKNSPPPSSEDRRKTRKAAASRRCQHKKKAQFLALRAQVTALETKLKELKDPIAKNSVWTLSSRELGQKLDMTQKHKVTQLWKNKAELEKQLRLRSEGRNKELKNVLARQSKVAQAVQEVLSNVTAVVHIEEALRTPLPTMPSVLEGFVPNLNDAIYGELSARLGRLYVDVTTTFESLDHTLVQDLSTGVQVRRDAVTGMPYVELRTAMATQLDLKQTEQAMMDLKACHYNNYRKYMTEQGTKKETEFELRDQDMAVELSTLSLSRCHEEENRLLFTFSSLVCDHPTNTAMRFREEGFILVTRSSTGTVLQSHYRLTPEINSDQYSLSGFEAQGTDPTELFVLQHLGDMMWSNFQRIQANCTESSQQSPASIPAY